MKVTLDCTICKALDRQLRKETTLTENGAVLLHYDATTRYRVMDERLRSLAFVFHGSCDAVANDYPDSVKRHLRAPEDMIIMNVRTRRLLEERYQPEERQNPLMWEELFSRDDPIRTERRCFNCSISQHDCVARDIKLTTCRYCVKHCCLVCVAKIALGKGKEQLHKDIVGYAVHSVPARCPSCTELMSVGAEFWMEERTPVPQALLEKVVEVSRM